MWDFSVAGHIDADATPKKAAIREIQEEIGLTISEKDLYKIGVFECFQTYESGITDNEFHNTFIAELNDPLSKLVLQEEEVEAIKLVSFIEFEALIKNIDNNNNHFVPSNKSYYEFVILTIKKHLNG